MSSETTDEFKKYLNKEITIKLRSDQIIRGNLRSFDMHLNFLLDKAQDITGEKAESLDTVIIRGDNILVISLPEE